MLCRRLVPLVRRAAPLVRQTPRRWESAPLQPSHLATPPPQQRFDEKQPETPDDEKSPDASEQPGGSESRTALRREECIARVKEIYAREGGSGAIPGATLHEKLVEAGLEASGESMDVIKAMEAVDEEEAVQILSDGDSWDDLIQRELKDIDKAAAEFVHVLSDEVESAAEMPRKEQTLPVAPVEKMMKRAQEPVEDPVMAKLTALLKSQNELQGMHKAYENQAAVFQEDLMKAFKKFKREVREEIAELRKAEEDAPLKPTEQQEVALRALLDLREVDSTYKAELQRVKSRFEENKKKLLESFKLRMHTFPDHIAAKEILGEQLALLTAEYKDDIERLARNHDSSVDDIRRLAGTSERAMQEIVQQQVKRNLWSGITIGLLVLLFLLSLAMNYIQYIFIRMSGKQLIWSSVLQYLYTRNMAQKEKERDDPQAARRKQHMEMMIGMA